MQFFIDKLKQGYWIHSASWEFDWYIDLFFAEVMSFGNYPIKIGYMQAILGDEFLDYKYKDLILTDFKDFYNDSHRVNSLLTSQSKILTEADRLIQDLKDNKFNKEKYERVQKDLSLLMASVSVVFDDLMPQAIEKIAKEENVSYSEAINYVIESSNKTKLNESNQKLISLYQKNKNEIEKGSFQFKKLSKTLQDSLKTHSEDYDFLNTGERGGKPWTPQQYLSQLKEISSIAKKNEAKLDLKKFSKTNKSSFENIIQININDNIAADKQVELDFLFQKYLQSKMGPRYKESILEYLSYDEICQVLDSPESIDNYKSREGNLKRVVWQQDGKIHTHYFDSEAEFKKVLGFVQSKNSGDTISGTVACKGVSEGIVRLIKTKADLDKFQRGEILVAEKTQPQYVMAMAIANAIITDVGGVTSHAAIIAREFGIPAIVGTRNATKILKDGERVRVDADEGKVYKL